MIKSKLKSIWHNVSAIIRLAIPVTIGIGCLWSMYWFVRDGYNQVFLPQKEMTSIKLTDADTIIVESPNNGNSGIIRPLIYISRTSDNIKTNSYTIKSTDPISFSITFPDAELGIVKYGDGKTLFDQAVPVGPNMRSKGKIKSLTVQTANLQQLRLQEFYYAQIIKFLPIGGMVWSDPDGSNLQIETVQGFSIGDTIKVTIEPFDVLSDFGNQKYDKIELNLKVTKGTAMGIVTISTSFGQSSLPDVGKDQTGKREGEAVSFLSSAESVKVTSPTGTIQVGNDIPIEMHSLAHLANETLELPRCSDNPDDAFKIASTITNGEYEISGITTSVVWKGQELNKSNWDKAPEYIRAGFFGLLLSVIGGLWALRQSIWKWLLSPFPFLKPKINLPQGSHIFIMKSGKVIAGELSSEPTKTRPYYIIKNARRKFNLSDEWEKEIVPEIQVREDAVEQSYVA